jgi:DNA-binding transcriptional ArsR family regulator
MINASSDKIIVFVFGGVRFGRGVHQSGHNPIAIARVEMPRHLGRKARQPVEFVADLGRKHLHGSVRKKTLLKSQRNVKTHEAALFTPLWLGLACPSPSRYPHSVTGIDCIAVLKALSDVTRMRIVRLLLKKQLGVNEISERLDVSQYNTSKHLRILKEAGLLEMEKQGKQRLYTVVSGLKNQLAANRNVLELKCCTFRFDKLPK